eukprot:CAMPEP_0179451662 /NCGR_PEP_ID=MMETSP0799-20121207/35743_1 /TAXON_ID=46947 /ORGANISM="Geminigera cryophila, Strain CCMP2564" /LENGTH=420 /DNA_ID=CAMNT_0021247199 /DNA_START=88 /DNA_END=1347 /DNA_ORIENTATION=+
MPKKKGGKGKDKGPDPNNPFDVVMAHPDQILELVSTRDKLADSLAKEHELKEVNRQLKEQLGQQKFEQDEIFAYLNKELVQKSRQVAILEARVQELELQVQYHQSDFDTRLMEEKAMAREMTAKLAREVGKYEKELGDLNVFISKKNDLEGELEETKTELLRERKKHEQIISELERKTVQEKERLRKEMEAKIREAKEAFMKLTDNHLEATTKKTMQENEQMGSELAFQNRETERLLAKNSKLSEDNRTAKRELELHKQTEAEMARRNHAYLRTIKSLLAKLKVLDQSKRDLERATKVKEESVVGQYKERVSLLQQTVEDAYMQLDEMRLDIEGKNSDIARLDDLKDEVSRFLLTAADDLKNELAKTQPEGSWIEESFLPALSDDGWRPGDPIPPRLDDLNLVQRERVLRYMVMRMADLP